MKILGSRLTAALGPTWIVGGLRWRLSPTGELCLQPSDLDLAAHRENGKVQVVKDGPHRTVYRVRLAEGDVFWKHCKISGLAAFLRQFIRPPKARLEFDAASRLAEHGIATIEPLAWGKFWWHWRGPSHLVTRELTNAVPLESWLEANAEGDRRRAAARELGRCLAQLHDAQVFHPDLHPGNLLVAVDAEGQPRFHLLDLHNVRVGSSRPLVDAVENLAVFNRWFRGRTARSDRARFWRAYAEARRLKSGDAHRLALAIEERTHRASLELWHDRDDRCFAVNRHFRRVKSSRWRGHAVKDIDPVVLARLLADPDEPFRDPANRLLKDSATSTVAEIVVATPAGPRPMIWKRFNLKKRGAALANRVRLSAALRSWRMGHALVDCGLPTPRPWLVLHHRGWLGPREGYLLCEKVEDAVELPDFLDRLAASPRDKRSALAILGRLLRQFHDSALHHRDLKASNLLVSGPITEPRFQFIDLVGVRRNAVSEPMRARDLSRLNVSFLHLRQLTRTDRLRFLRAYLRWALHGGGEWKKWWEWIGEASRVKVERNRRSGRSLS